MSATLYRLSLALVATIITTTAFAQGGQGIGRSGSYEGPPNYGPGVKTRAEVRAELESSRTVTPAAQEEHNREIVRSVTGVVNDSSKTTVR
ncbi:hypothetical protein P0D71_04115 [Paraburkholderia sp. RL17-383-BIF-A]|uniref:hypothetical protein n=1 Tax=Paraburkholderia sp. RL17-383-BIF-A TaxID=3031631 RepID=UPI0038B8A437